MGLFAIAALCAIKKREEERSRRSRSYSSKKNSYESSGGYQSPETVLVHWAEKEIQSEGSVLFDFFKQLSEKYSECIKRSIESFEKEKIELENKIEPLNRQIEKFCNVMKEKGIEFSIDTTYPVSITIGNTSFPAYNYTSLINEAIPKVIEQLEKSKDEALYKANMFEKDYTEDLKKSKRAIFGKEEKLKKASLSRERLEREKKKYQECCIKQETLKKFISVSHEYRDLYNASVFYYGGLIKSHSEVSGTVSRLKEIEGSYYSIDHTFMERAYSMLFIEGKITSDLIIKINKYMDSKPEIIDSEKTSEQYESLSSNEKERLGLAAKWFITGYYKNYSRNKKEQVPESTAAKTLAKKL